jgi:hypothetical protein
MRWAHERRWQLRIEITLCRVKLGLEEKDAAGEIGTAEVSASEVSPEEVGHSHVSTSQVSSDQVRASQVGGSEVRAAKVLAGEVGSFAVNRAAPDPGSHYLARTKQ